MGVCHDCISEKSVRIRVWKEKGVVVEKGMPAPLKNAVSPWAKKNQLVPNKNLTQSTTSHADAVEA
jgi:hypothetical protein